MSDAVREVLAIFGFEVHPEELEKGEKKIESFLSKLKEVGEAIVVAFAYEKFKEFTVGLAEQAEKLELQAASLGTSAEALQEWQYAANMVGVGADQLTGAMMRLEKAAAGGGKGGGAGLAALGIKAKDANGQVKPVTALMDEVAEGISKVEDKSKRTQIAMQLFGKSGAKLIPLFEQGQEGIKKYREEVQRLGGGITDDFIKKSKDMIQNQKRLNFAMLGAKVNIVGALLPSITSLLEKMVLLFGWVHKNIDIVTAFKSAAILLAVGGIMKVSAAIGPLNLKLLMTLAQVALLAVAFFALDDAMHFFMGNESLIGNLLDEHFGKGSADKVRKWFTDYDALSRTAGSSQAGFLTQIVATGVQMAAVFAAGTKDADAFYRVVDGVWRSIVLGAQVAWEILRNGWATVGATIEDVITAPVRAMQNMAARSDVEDWKKSERERLKRERNDPNSKYKGTADQTFDTPEQRAKDEAALTKAGDAMYEQTRTKSAGEVNEKYSAQQKQKLVDEYDRISQQLDPRFAQKQAAEAERVSQVNGVGTRFNADYTPVIPPNVTANTTIHVHLPEGTTAEHGKAVAEVAGKEHEKTLREAHAATSTGGPRS